MYKNHDQIYTNVPKIMIISTLFLRLMWTDVIFIFHFGLFLALLSPPQPLTTQKIKILQK